MKDPSSETVRLLERLRRGDRQALVDLYSQHRDRLRRMVEVRMDSRLQGRVEASDVLQDGFLDVATRLEGYLRSPKLPPFLWLRLIVSERLAIYHRRHLGARMRDVAQEVSLYQQPMPQASSAALASMLLGRLTTPSKAAIRAERVLRVQEAINSLDAARQGSGGAATFRAAQPRRDGPVAGHHRGSWGQAIYPGLKKLETILSSLKGGSEG